MGLQLKSDQNGIEIVGRGLGARDYTALKSDQNGIEISEVKGDDQGPCPG